MANESILNATAWTLLTQGMLVHPAQTGDVTPTDSPTIGAPTVTDVGASFPHTPPSDSDYAYTVIKITPVNGSTPIAQATGSGAWITLTSGLSASMAFDGVPYAVDADGNYSEPGRPVRFLTAASAVPALPIMVKFQSNNRSGWHEHSPVYVPDQRGSHKIGGMVPVCEFRNLKVCIESWHPTWTKWLGVEVRVSGREGRPYGLQDRT